jgi:hypothetical protein
MSIVQSGLRNKGKERKRHLSAEGKQPEKTDKWRGISEGKSVGFLSRTLSGRRFNSAPRYEKSSSGDGLLLFYEHRQVTLSAFLRQLVFLLIGIGTIAFFHFGI